MDESARAIARRWLRYFRIAMLILGCIAASTGLACGYTTFMLAMASHAMGGKIAVALASVACASFALRMWGMPRPLQLLLGLNALLLFGAIIAACGRRRDVLDCYIQIAVGAVLCTTIAFVLSILLIMTFFARYRLKTLLGFVLGFNLCVVGLLSSEPVAYGCGYVGAWFLGAFLAISIFNCDPDLNPAAAPKAQQEGH